MLKIQCCIFFFFKTPKRTEKENVRAGGIPNFTSSIIMVYLFNKTSSRLNSLKAGFIEGIGHWKFRVSAQITTSTNKKQRVILISPCSILLLQAFITLCLTLVFIFYVSTLKTQFIITTNENNAFSIMIIAFLIYFFSKSTPLE